MTERGTLAVLRASMCESRGIALGVWWNIALLVGALSAMPLDHRKILGLNPWVKPAKFDISVIVFLLTVGVMLWALGRKGEWRRSRWWLGWIFGVAMIVENSIISLQSARGVRSHMNYATPLDGMLFGVMGVFIVLSSVMAGWLLVLWCVATTEYKRVVVWGVRIGLLMLLVASAEGVRMVLLGGHTVGAADGGPGLPLTNWSRVHGDLRVAHFFGLHAMQIFPLAGVVLAMTRWREQFQIAILVGFAVTYSLSLWWLFTQAMQGISVVRDLTW